MLILGIETATSQVGVAIGGHEGVLGLFEAAKGRRHAETLAPAIEFVCKQAHVELTELGAISVDVGPGLFTGMRVGMATAMAMAQALRIPVIGISSLDLLAYPLRNCGHLIASVIDARRGEVFYALYRQVPGGVQRVFEPQVGRVEDVVAELITRPGDTLLVGDGALRYRQQIEDVVRVEFADQFLAHPSAAPLVSLAHARAMREEWVNASELRPLYLRRPDAEINWETRQGRAS